jgi:hypothetical protein
VTLSSEPVQYRVVLSTGARPLPSRRARLSQCRSTMQLIGSQEAQASLKKKFFLFPRERGGAANRRLRRETPFGVESVRDGPPSALKKLNEKSFSSVERE